MEDHENILEEINQRELPFKSWLPLAWAMFWRGLITMVGATISGALVGFVLGFIVGIVCAIIKYPFESIKIPFQIFCGTLGLGIGFLFVVLQMKWFFRADFREFRIAIIKKKKAQPGIGAVLT
jgi:uncharacterized membrane protein YjjP (DUF1212 family)